MNDPIDENLIKDFEKTTEFTEGGELSSELARGKSILGFINMLDVLGMRNSSNLTFRLSVSDTLWETLKVKSENDTIKEVDKILTLIFEPKRKYQKSMDKAIIPRRKNTEVLYNLMCKYNLALRKEAERQLNPRKK